MPARKLVYQVEADTAKAIRDLRKLGDAGGDAGDDIAQGFKTASAQSEAAIKALSATLDGLESDAKGTAEAVSAIKAHLSVDVDDAQIATFANDVKNRMGVTFDQITADAKQFADVLERGVNMDRTRAELRGVGDELEHVRGESDQSRSVLANLAGNAAQDLGALGGVVGSLGVGVGQLAEYAVDGNIAMSNLANVAGPMAGLSAALFVVQRVMGDIAKEKALDAERARAYAKAIEDAGIGAAAVVERLREADDIMTQPPDDRLGLQQMLFGEDPLDVVDELNKINVTAQDIGHTFDDLRRTGQGIKDDDFAAFLASDDIQAISLALEGLGISGKQNADMIHALFKEYQAYGGAVDGAARDSQFFASTTESINEALRAQLDPLALINQGFADVNGTQVDLHEIFGIVAQDLRDGQADYAGTAHYIDLLAEATGVGADKIAELAQEQGNAAKSTADLQTKTVAATDAARDNADALHDQVDALQALIDKQSGQIDAAEQLADAQQAWDDSLEAFPAVIDETTKAMDKETKGSKAWVDARNAQRDALTQMVDEYTTATELQAKMNGQEFTAVQRHQAQARALGQLAGQLSDDVIPQLTEYYQNLFNIPDTKRTEFETILLEGDQAKIEAFIAANSGTKSLAIAVGTEGQTLAAAESAIAGVASKHYPANIDVQANTKTANDQIGQFRRTQESTPIYVKVAATGAPSGFSKSAASTGATAAAPAMLGAAATSAGPSVFAPSITIRTAVVGDRFDVQRVVTRAVRGAVRLAGARP